VKRQRLKYEFVADYDLLDQFAAAVLTGMIASSPIADRTKVDKAKWAKVAYDFAASMMAERNARTRKPNRTPSL
jgi:hypothetical protein